jgi:hypothetical protein
LRPDNPITETGTKAGFTHSGIRSRYGRKRVDVEHTWMDALIVAGSWMLPIYFIGRRLRRRK